MTDPCFSSFSAHCHPVDFFHSLNTHCLLWPQDLCTFVLILPSLSETLSSWLLDSLKLHCCYFLRKAFPASPLPNIPPTPVSFALCWPYFSTCYLVYYLHPLDGRVLKDAWHTAGTWERNDRVSESSLCLRLQWKGLSLFPARDVEVSL